MGYLGKPSAGCLRCRTKRTRCDQRKPSCTQCLRVGSQCTGYRDEFSLIFRDQSRKFYGQGGPGPLSKRAGRAYPAPGRIEETVINLLGTSTQDQAICFFLRSWILKTGNESLHRKSYFEHIPDILDNEPTTSPLLPSVLCLGKAALAKHTQSAGMQTSADVNYALALQLTNKALTHPEEAASDRLLIAVLLLGLYEPTSHRQIDSIKSWTKHTNGVAALLSLRGKQQFRTHLGVRLFGQAQAQCIASCIHTRTIAPQVFVDGIPDDAAFETEEERYSSKLSDIFVRFCNSRIRMTTADIPTEEPEPPMLIPELIAIELQFADWVQNIPESMLYQTATLDSPCETAYKGKYHIYDSAYSVIIWSQYRTVRLHCLVMLDLRLHKLNTIEKLGFIPPLSSDDRAKRDHLHRSVWQTLKQLALDVCGSVPFFLGFGDRGKHPEHRIPTSSAQAVGGSILIWPLYTAGATRYQENDEIKAWIIRTLERVTELTGYEQGMVMAQALLEGREKKTVFQDAS